MTIILLIRHGLNDEVGKRLAGRTAGIHLNEQGRQQAASLAETLKDFPVKAIYSSPMERTLETAAPVAEALSLTVQVHPGLIEVDYGDWRGKTLKELQSFELWKEVRDNPAAVRFPNGESLRETQDRAQKTIQEIADGYEKDDLVLCFTHGDIIRLSTAYFLEMDLNDFQHLVTNPDTITELRFYEDRVFLVRYNQCLNLNSSQYCDSGAVKAG